MVIALVGEIENNLGSVRCLGILVALGSLIHAGAIVMIMVILPTSPRVTPLEATDHPSYVVHCWHIMNMR
jgi:hypothetical protein